MHNQILFAMRHLALPLLLLVAMAAQAYGPASELHIDLSAHPRGTQVILNGQTYGLNNGLEVVSGLAPGRYKLVVVRPNHRGRQMVFSGQVNVPASSVVTAFVGHRNDLRVSARPIAYHQGPSYWDEPCHTPVVQPVGHCGTPVVLGMSPDVFGMVRNSISRLSFDSDRLAIARQAVQQNGCTAAQVAELMRMLSFESSRLDLAKHAYSFTADQQNYFVVYDCLTFSSSVRELQQYIGY